MEHIALRRIPDYELLDSGDGEKLERFGTYTLSRPDPNAIWEKRLHEADWKKADAFFKSEKSAAGARWNNKRVREPWIFSFEQIRMRLKLTPFKHTGLFPEQIENWKWFESLLRSRPDAKVLNLFGYTGGATLFAASCGAQVTHIDASKPAIQWARENQDMSSLKESPIRWIVEDAITFAERETRRGNSYDAVILDPPAFGRSPKGKVFKFEKDVPKLLGTVQKLLSPHPLFVLLNSYATGYSPQVFKNCVSDAIPGSYEFGELAIPHASDPDRLLPCSQFVRVIPKK